MSCHRCGQPMTLYIVGWDYCPPCSRDIKTREAQDERRRTAKARFRVVKDFMPLYPGAA